MGTERQPLNSVITSTNLSSATVALLDDDPDSPGGDWVTADDDKSAGVLVVGFPTPTGNPTTGAGVQEFKIYTRLTVNGNACSYNIYLSEAGTRRNGGTAIASGSVTSTTGQLITATWNASLLSTADGSDVELDAAFGFVGGGPSSRTAVEVDAVEWNVTYDAASITGTLAATESFTDTVAITADADADAVLAHTEAADAFAITADADADATLAHTEAADVFAIAAGVEYDATLGATEGFTDTVAITAEMAPADAVLAITEPVDVFAITADADAGAVLAGTETVDVFAITADADADAALTATDSPDVFAFTADADADAVLAITEPVDVFAFTATLTDGASASFAITEPFTDTFAITADADAAATLGAVEAPDVFAITAGVDADATMSATEGFTDTAAITADADADATMGAVEGFIDTLLVVVDVDVGAVLGAVEGPDVFAVTSNIEAAATLGAVEAPDVVFINVVETVEEDTSTLLRKLTLSNTEFPLQHALQDLPGRSP